MNHIQSVQKNIGEVEKIPPEKEKQALKISRL